MPEAVTTQRQERIQTELIITEEKYNQLVEQSRNISNKLNVLREKYNYMLYS